MAKTVLVTRPRPGAAGTADRLRKLGHVPLVLPLTRIVAVPPVPPEGPFDAVAITSANALRQAPPAFLRPWLDLPCLAVGEATAQAAGKAGFRHVVAGGGDGTALARTLGASLKAHARVLYLTGRIRSPGFEQAVTQAGRGIVPAVVYDTVPLDYPDGELVTFFGSEPVSACLLYSRFGARGFRQLTERGSVHHLFEKTEVLCLSAPISEIFDDGKPRLVRVAVKPDEAALLDLLRD
ncbi:MAG: uroporphyrinogen-III synthase [Alphaproteobacteria bacterium]